MSITLALVGALTVPTLIAFTGYAESRISRRRERCCCCPFNCGRTR